MQELTNKIEAILFYLAGPVEIDFLIKILDVDRKKILSAIEELGQNLEGRSNRLVFHNDEVSLVTAPEYSEIIEKVIKEEREKDLGRAGIETLSIVAYKGPVSKKEIEYIRGVNSQYALRNLLLRGLIERKSNETDARSMSYNITVDTLRYLGLSRISDLPEYNEVKKQLEIKEDSISSDEESETD